MSALGHAAPRGLRLHHGPLVFSALELGQGPTVLCLHGFPDHARSFRFQLPALAAAGYRAIAVTMRGYEPSSIPAASSALHPAAIATDVTAWLDELGVARAHLVGHDWGAVVSYLAVAAAPARFASLATLAVPHLAGIARAVLLRRPSQLWRSRYMAFFQLRGLADHWIERDDFRPIESLWRRWSPGWRCEPEELAAVKATLAAPGVTRAALGYYRTVAHPLSPEARRMWALFAEPWVVPTLALTGARDGCIDTRLYDDLARTPGHPSIRIERLHDAGHFLHQERPDEVNRLLLDWLAEHPIG